MIMRGMRYNQRKRCSRNTVTAPGSQRKSPFNSSIESVCPFLNSAISFPLLHKPLSFDNSHFPY